MQGEAITLRFPSIAEAPLVKASLFCADNVAVGIFHRLSAMQRYFQLWRRSEHRPAAAKNMVVMRAIKRVTDDKHVGN
jgi:hypothetical protein